ncbi:MAG TPA: class I SAM-dependent methyltransferase [Stellaceae bacterium]|jgi:predicted O-methyltransferase YrrM
MVAERDEWLLRREARIATLETTIANLENALHDRENAVRRREHQTEEEIARREVTIRDREERIAWLEDQVRRLETPRLLPRTDDLQLRLKDVVARLPGWCPEEKARWMVDRILDGGYKTAAEIGVFAGRSVFPIAFAIAANKGTAVYAVDAWENEAATSSPTEYQNDVWWDNVDLVGVKNSFLREIISQNLTGVIKIFELPSNSAYLAIKNKIGRSIDFLHIDGAHSETQANFDVTHWSELVTPGGMIVLDDIDWPGVRDAAVFLSDKCEKIDELRGKSFAFAAFRVQ